ncbi:MAG: type VI secretion system baseplate subunit TssE [Geminicoccaceae bacterium]|nr:type VI secretion system baseplate subunit TssE [Geminicoccaceae bacterium]
MAEPTLLERLQPALIDRLRDPEASLGDAIAARRAALEVALDEAQRAALARLLARPDLEARRLERELGPPLEGLPAERLTALGELVALEQTRRLEAARAARIGMRELRAAVLRDLGALLNAENLEGFAAAEGGGTIALLDGLPAVRASVANYGIPALAGKVHTRADCEALARAIALAIERFEPRLRAVVVTADRASEDPGAPAGNPVSFLLAGELWGHPLTEPLRLRTVLDLEEGRARLAPAEEGG